MAKKKRRKKRRVTSTGYRRNPLTGLRWFPVRHLLPKKKRKRRK